MSWFDFVSHVRLPKTTARTHRVVIGIAPADTLLWMDSAGRIYQDPDMEFCLLVARDWAEYVDRFLENPGIVYFGGGPHGWVAAVRGLDAAALSQRLGVPIGGMAFGSLPAVWDDDVTCVYAAANTITLADDDGATFSTNDPTLLVDVLKHASEQPPFVRIDTFWPSRGLSWRPADELARARFRLGRQAQMEGTVVLVRDDAGAIRALSV